MKKIVILPIIAIVVALAVILVIYSLGGMGEIKKVEISNSKIDYGSGLYLDPTANLYLTVANRYTSLLTAIGATVNSVNYGFSNWQIPSGQTSDVILSLKDLTLTSSTSYNVKLTFSFQDGEYYDLSTTFSTPSTLTPTEQPPATTAQEKVAIQSVDTTNSKVLAQNMGSVDVTITAAIVKDPNGNVISTDGTGGTLAPGVIGDISFDTTGLTSGRSYTVTLVSAKGDSFVSPSFTAP